MSTIDGSENRTTTQAALQVVQPLAQIDPATVYTQNSASSIDTPVENRSCLLSILESIKTWLSSLWQRLVHLCCGSSSSTVHHLTSTHGAPSDFPYFLERKSYELASNCFQGGKFTSHYALNPDTPYLGIIHFRSADGVGQWRQSYFFSELGSLSTYAKYFTSTAKCGPHETLTIQAYFAQKNQANTWEFYVALCNAYLGDCPEPTFTKLGLLSWEGFNNIINTLDPETQNRVRAELQEQLIF